MKAFILLAVFLFCGCLVAFLTCGFGQDTAGGRGWGQDTTGGNIGSHTARAKDASRSAQYHVSEILGRDVTIPSKGSQVFSSTLDFSGASRATISITTLETGTTLTNVRIGVAWAVRDIQESWFILTDVIKGSSFFFTDHGGVNVPVAGEALRILVWNDGTAPVVIRQLNVYSPKGEGL